MAILSYFQESPGGLFDGAAALMAPGYVGQLEFSLRYSTVLKFHNIDPFYKYTLAHVKNTSVIIPNMFPLLLNMQMNVDGFRWNTIDPYIQIIVQFVLLILWFFKILFVVIFDAIFAYTDGAHCSFNFWCYRWIRINFFLICIFISYIKFKKLTVEIKNITINLNMDMIIFIKKYLSFSTKRWTNYFYGINS